jgi:hypothetical protein
MTSSTARSQIISITSLPSTVTVFLSIFTPTVVRYLSEKIL